MRAGQEILVSRRDAYNDGGGCEISHGQGYYSKWDNLDGWLISCGGLFFFVLKVQSGVHYDMVVLHFPS